MITLDDGRVLIEFQVERDGFVYSDAIVGEADEIAALTQTDIEAIKADRFECWLVVVRG